MPPSAQSVEAFGIHNYTNERGGGCAPGTPLLDLPLVFISYIHVCTHYSAVTVVFVVLFQIPELSHDFSVPEYCYLSSGRSGASSDVKVNAWFGPKGTLSPLHFDPDHNLLSQVSHKW